MPSLEIANNEKLHYKALSVVKKNNTEVVKNLEWPWKIEKIKITDLLDPDRYEIIKSTNWKTILMEKYSKDDNKPKKWNFTTWNVFLLDEKWNLQKIKINNENSEYNKNHIVTFINKKQFEENWNTAMTLQDIKNEDKKDDDTYKLYINWISSKEYNKSERYENKIPNEIRWNWLEINEIKNIEKSEKWINFEINNKKYGIQKDWEINAIK